MITYQTITQAWYIVQIQGDGPNVWGDTENRQPATRKGFDDACKWAKEAATTEGKPYRVIKRTDEHMEKFDAPPAEAEETQADAAEEKPPRRRRKKADETND